MTGLLEKIQAVRRLSRATPLAPALPGGERHRRPSAAVLEAKNADAKAVALARSALGEGARAYRESLAPSPQPTARWGEGALRVCGYCCEMATPHGCSPSEMLLITRKVATSMTDTSFDTPLVTNRSFSSGVNAICQTRWPTSRYFCTSWVAALIAATRLAGPSATNAVLPSPVMRMPTGWIASLRRPGISKAIFFLTSNLTGSMTLMVPPISDDTHTSEPSRLNSA